MELTAGDLVAKRFRLERKLGEGGMGTVWEATHTVTQRKHALKLLKTSAPTQRSRFIREARAASAVDHPNIIRIDDVFELDDGMPVLVLELLRGEPLSAMLGREVKLTVARMAEILLPVASAVGAAHARGIVHRDLKPDNIFLSDGGVKVLDFGIAKLGISRELASTEGALTKTGALLGTPYYMSPEQASGEPVDHRTDIWSLGIIAYQSLSGVLPTQADSVGAALKIVMTGRIPALDPQAIDGDEIIASLVRRMLALERTDRPDDLREVMDVLARYCDVDVPPCEPPASPRDEAIDPADIETGQWLADREAATAPDAVASDPTDTAPPVEEAPSAAAPTTQTAGSTTEGTAKPTSVTSVERTRGARWIPAAAVVAIVGAGVWYATRDAPAPPVPKQATSAPSPATSPSPANSKLVWLRQTEARIGRAGEVSIPRTSAGWRSQLGQLVEGSQ